MPLVNIDLKMKDCVRELSKIPSWLGYMLVFALLAGICYYGYFQFNFVPANVTEISQIQKEVDKISKQMTTTLGMTYYQREHDNLISEISLLNDMLSFTKDMNNMEIQLIINHMTNLNPNDPMISQLKAFEKHYEETYEIYDLEMKEHLKQDRIAKADTIVGIN